MQRHLDLGAPHGAVIQMWPRGHVTMGHYYVLVYDSSAETFVKEWIAKLHEQFETNAKIAAPPPIVQPTQVLTKDGEPVSLIPLSDEDKKLCTCGHIVRVHVEFKGECCEGACKCAAFNADTPG